MCILHIYRSRILCEAHNVSIESLLRPLVKQINGEEEGYEE